MKLSICGVLILIFLTCFVRGLKTCNKTATMSPRQFFDPNKAVGLWYPQEVYTLNSEDAVPFKAKCLSANYSGNSNSKKLTLTETFVNSETDGTESVSSKIEFDMKESAIWHTTYEKSDGAKENSSHVWLHTNYKDWEISYTCKVQSSSKTYEAVIIWSRNRKMSPDTLQFLRCLVEGYGFSLENVRVLNQSDCS